ncbi:unnamed protein product [Parnassius apollo]|uniref:(apollo) hypothetical protein n=1 Tax=Parnassius apollo TaxID=110799 RepID=A0A8S3X798_PARAO|nr:unnamed protein product [Parnassius apollo]
MISVFNIARALIMTIVISNLARVLENITQSEQWPENGLLDNVLDEGFAQASCGFQLVNPTTGVFEDVTDCSEPDAAAEDKRAKRGSKTPLLGKGKKNNL